MTESRPRIRWPTSALVAAMAVVPASCTERDSPSPRGTLTVFAAASTTDVLREAGRRFEARTGIEVVLSLGASSNLARQIKAGAPADVYVSADQRWMDDLEAAGAIRPDTRRDLLTNRLALIAPPDSRLEVPMTGDFDFTASLPQVRRVAVGDPSHVPAGRYARQALESLGWWDALEPLLVPAPDVRAALRLVEIAEADAGIVYSTDARRSNKVQVVAAFPPALHEPIRYPIALCSDAPAGAQFIDFLGASPMRAVFEAAGFRVPPVPTGGAD